MQRFGISKDKARKLLEHIKNINKKLNYKIVPAPQKNANIVEKKAVKANPYTPNTPEWSNHDQLERRDVTIGEIYVMCFLRMCSQYKVEVSDALVKMPDTLAKISDALDTVSMPWLPGNNWKSMVLRKKDPFGKTVLHLLQLDPLDLKEDIEAILVAVTEMNRPKGRKSPEPTTPATPAIQPPQHYPISPECPYRKNNQTYAAIWQILKNNRDGILPELLKTKAMEITGEAPGIIDEAIFVVTSRRNPDGQGRDPRALPGPGYWVERSKCGKLTLRLPNLPEEWTDTDSDDNPEMTSRNPIVM